jgi:hypothetical protein
MPDQARAALDLLPRERVLTAARTTDGEWIAATELALVGAGLRIAWADVAHAQWLDEESVLVIDPVTGSAQVRLGLAEPGRLPETVHERVMASIVLTRRIAVPSGGAVRVVARTDRSGDVVWQVLPDAGVDADDPDVRRVVDDAVAALRGELGR